MEYHALKKEKNLFLDVCEQKRVNDVGMWWETNLEGLDKENAYILSLVLGI